ncbi:MAG: hypothetical protein ACRDNL_12395 [Spirillospora sp.]
MRRWHRRLALALTAVLRRLAVLVTARTARARLREAVLVRLLLWRCAPLVLLLLLRRRRELLVLWGELLVRRGELLVRRRVVGHRGLLLLLLLWRRAPLVLLLWGLLLRHTPRVAAGCLLLRHLATTRLLLRRLAVRRLRVVRLPVLVGRLLLGPLLRGHGRRAPRVRLLRLALLRLALLRRTPGVRRLPGGRLGSLLLVRVGRLLVRLTAALRTRWRSAVLRLAALLRAGRRVARLLLVVVSARARTLSTAGAGQVRPAAHAEQIARLERFVTDRTFQGRHDTSPERTPARSRLETR